MSINGRLDDFTLSEILQIISLSKRSGILTLIGPKGSGKLVLRHGRVVYASCDTRNRLGYALVHKKIVSDQDLERALQHQRDKTPDKPIGTILLEMGLVAKEVLEDELRKHIARVFRDLLGWDSGIFYFQVQKAPADSVTIMEEGISTEFLLLQGARLHDEGSNPDLDRELWP